MMKKILLSVGLLSLMATSTLAGSGDSGVPLADGVNNGVDAQAQMMSDMGPFAILLLPLTPLFLAGGLVVDTTEKLAGQ